MTLKEALAQLADEMAKAPDERDPKKLTALLETMGKLAEAPDAETRGYAGTEELTAQIAQLRQDLDAQIERTRRLERLGLAETPDRRIRLLGHEGIMDLRKVGRVFQYKEDAQRFGALAAKAIFGGRADYKEMVAKRTREYADDLIKQLNKDLDPGVAGSGAELVANLYMADLIVNVEGVGTLFPLCDRVPLQTTGQTTWPKLTGELTAYPTAVAAKIAESVPTYDTVTLTPVKWATLTPVPNEFFRNPTLLDAMGQRVAWLITRAIAYAWDNALVNGDGTADYGTITGLLQDGTLTVITADSATSLGAYTATEIGKIIAGISKTYVIDPIWGFSLSAQRTVRNIRTGGENLPLYDRGSGGEPNTIDGYPYKVCQLFPAAGAVGAAAKWGIFGQLNLSHYFGLLTNITIATSEHSRFEYDVTVIRGLASVDSAVKDTNAVVVAKTHA